MILLLVLLAGGTTASAQTQWDSVLDKYEQICNQCIDLRQKIVDGESVSTKSLTSLLQDLSSLRSTLQNGVGSMSASQKRRFERIRDRYSSIVGSSETKASQNGTVSKSAEGRLSASSKSESSKDKARSVQVPVAPADTAKPADEPVARDEIMLFRIDSSFQAAATLIGGSSQMVIPERQSNNSLLLQNERATRFGVSLQAGYQNTPSFGLRTMVVHERIGAYVSFLSNFDFEKGAYTVDSEGNILSGGSFWSNGASKRASYSVTAGALYSSFKNFSFGLGAGYSNNTMLWKDIGGVWAEVEDYTYRGAVIEASALYTYKGITFSASLQMHPSSMTVTPVIGVGYLF